VTDKKDRAPRRKLTLKDRAAELDRKIDRSEKALHALKQSKQDMLEEHRARIEAEQQLLDELK
jgi:hypothetical protein